MQLFFSHISMTALYRWYRTSTRTADDVPSVCLYVLRERRQFFDYEVVEDETASDLNQLPVMYLGVVPIRKL